MSAHPHFPNLFVVDHPVVQDNLSKMRDVTTSFSDFRACLNRIALLMAYSVTAAMPLVTKQITTPLVAMDAPVLAEQDPVIVPILRAGLGMIDGLLQLFPAAIIGHVGLYRDELTHVPHEYLVRLPRPVPQDRRVIVVDPMLATGQSAVHAMDVLVANGFDAARISLMTLLAAPEGVTTFHARYPHIPVYTAALDSHLNADAYIVPGLGDAGDRIFGTII